MNLPKSSSQFVDVENNLSHYIVPHFVTIIEEKAENETKSFVPKSLIELYAEDGSNGNTTAMMQVAMMYLNGERVEMNIDNAIKWFIKAAYEGEVEAMYKLGHIYEDDLIDISKAFEWFKKGAENDDARCMSNVGRMYYEGVGIEQNKLKAIEWLTQAAENGREWATNKLGQIYKEDSELKDYPKAFEWFKKAAEKGDTQAMYNLGSWCYYYGNGTEKNINLSIEWLIKAAESKDLSAKCLLVDIYKDEHYSLQKKDVKWLNVFAKDGDVWAMCQLAFYYFLDEKNYEKSFEWYKKAAEYGDAFAMFKLGLYYYKGIGTERNIDLATRWLTKNTEKGEGYADDRALILLGRIYNEELHDYKKSFEFYQMASQGNLKDTEYMYYLGLFYYEGKGTIQNKSLAIDWLVKAATTYKNDRFGFKAMNKLGHIYSYDKDLKDDTNAYKWFCNGADGYYENIDLDSLDSIFNQGLLNYCGKSGLQINPKSHLTLQQIGMGDIYMAAEKGHVLAMFIYALIRKGKSDEMYGLVTKEWPAQSYKDKPLYIDNVIYDYSQSRCFYKGIGTQKDIDKAILYMTKVEKAFQNRIENELDIMLYTIWGTPPKNRILYELGVMYEDAACLYDNAFLHHMDSVEPGRISVGLRECGKTAISSYEKAFQYYKKSADLGYIPAIGAIVRCYIKGIGTLRDTNKATYWSGKGFDLQKNGNEYNGNEYNMLIYGLEGKRLLIDKF